MPRYTIEIKFLLTLPDKSIIFLCKKIQDLFSVKSLLLVGGRGGTSIIDISVNNGHNGPHIPQERQIDIHERSKCNKNV